MADLTASERITKALTQAAQPTLRFFVPVAPVPKGRPRVAGYHAYTPVRTKAFEEQVGWAAKAVMGAAAQLITVPVFVDMTFIKLHSSADIDNAIKSVLDGMQGVVFDNDRQVKAIAAWREVKGQPGVFVEVVPI